MLLTEWVKKWNISDDAIADLRIQFGVDRDHPAPHWADNKSEAAIMNIIKLEATNKGCRLWRNNVGAFATDTGFVRYGLANESTAVNRVVKSADLIGIRPVIITTAHIGHTIGQFLSREVKRNTWAFHDSPEERAQLKWIELVVSMGGDAAFATGEGTL
jgi:hypothetical protein